MQVDSHISTPQHTPRRTPVVLAASSHGLTPKPSVAEMKQMTSAFDGRKNCCGKEAMSTDRSMWPTVMTAFPQTPQPYSVQIPQQQPIYAMPAGMPMQQFATAASAAVPPDPSRMATPVPFHQYGLQMSPMTGSPFRCEVPPPGYSPPTLAAPTSFSYPPPPVCGCTITSMPMPASFSVQYAQPVSPTFVQMQAAGAAPVPFGGAPVPMNGAPMPVGGIPVMYNICTPMMDHQQAYEMSVCSGAFRSTVVTQDTKRIVEQGGGDDKQSYVKFSHEETLRHSTVQKAMNSADSMKGRKEKVNPKYKTKPCNKFSEKGCCPYGQACQFIHEMPSNKADERNTPTSTSERTNKKVDHSTQTLSPDSTSDPSTAEDSNDMASRLYSSTPISIRKQRFHQQPQPGSDPRVPPGKSVSYLHNFSAGCRKPQVIDGLHLSPLVHEVASEREEGDQRE